jgi:hypothetical protein
MTRAKKDFKTIRADRVKEGMTLLFTQPSYRGSGERTRQRVVRSIDKRKGFRIIRAQDMEAGMHFRNSSKVKIAVDA